MSPTHQAALDYHESPRPGKISVIPSKRCLTQRDLALAYTPGVAAPCLAIKDDPEAVFHYTSKGNLVAVVSNGTAVLGLGDLGPLAAKLTLEVLNRRRPGMAVVCEAVSIAVYRVQKAGPVRIVLNLLPNPGDCLIHQSGDRRIRVAPHLPQ